MIVLKLFASLLLLVCIFVGIKKADAKTHNPNHREFAEYMTGFIFTFGGVWGLYILWW
jgi:hypothetical protein